jgi:hypothetical protein
MARTIKVSIYVNETELNVITEAAYRKRVSVSTFGRQNLMAAAQGTLKEEECEPQPVRQSVRQPQPQKKEEETSNTATSSLDNMFSDVVMEDDL